MDMASGAQTIANGGLHHEPYYVEWIDTADGQRIYTHADAGTQVLDRRRRPGRDRHAEGRARSRAPAATTRSRAAARRPARPAPRPTTRTPGSSGSRREITTAVWVGDPNGYTPMVNVPEFGGANASACAGRPLPDADLEDVHGPGARRPAVPGLGAAATARPPAGAPVPARQRVPVPHASPPAARSSAPSPAAAAARRRAGPRRLPEPATGAAAAARPAGDARRRRRRAAGAACPGAADGDAAGTGHPDHGAGRHAPRGRRRRHDRAARRPRPAGADPVDAVDQRRHAPADPRRIRASCRVLRAGATRTNIDARRSTLGGRDAVGAVLARGPYGGGVLTDDLLELQRLDTLADQLTYRRAHLPERAAAQELAGALAEHRRRRAASVERSEELELAIDALERDGEQLGAQRDASRGPAEDRHRAARGRGADARAGDDRRAPRRARRPGAGLPRGAVGARRRDRRARRRAARRSRPTPRPRRRRWPSPRPRSTPSWPRHRRPACASWPAGSTPPRSIGTSGCGPATAASPSPGSRAAAAAGATSTCRPPRSSELRAVPAGEFADCPNCGRLLVA